MFKDDSSSVVCSIGIGVSSNDNSSIIVHFAIVPPINLSFPIKLDKSNYLVWKKQLLWVIWTYRFEDYVDGTKVIPDKYFPYTSTISLEFFV